MWARLETEDVASRCHAQSDKGIDWVDTMATAPPARRSQHKLQDPSK